ncbi:MAG: hypothetical protein DYG89_32530 [Caldilinea sp. CFX5]|nr:hypothetical protein [Caldilinea sp. CFX5]
MRIPVPHFHQETAHTCLPACVRMVLAFLGDEQPEQKLALAFQTAPKWGTLPEHVETALTTWGYRVRWFEGATLERLEQLHANHFPVIAFLRAVDLPHGTGGLHALVIVDMDEQSVTCLDPVLDHDLTLAMADFLRIWSRLDNQGMVIWR